MAHAVGTVEIRIGPNFRTCLDVLELAKEMLDDGAFDWSPDKDEFRSRAGGLHQRVVEGLQEAFGRTGVPLDDVEL